MPLPFPRLQFPHYTFRLREIQGKHYIFDEIRKKYVALTPEEWVRQHLLQYLLRDMNYPRSSIGVEMLVTLNGMPQRCDVAIWNKYRQAVLLAECKAPHIAISPSVFEQTARYNLVLKVRYCLITNGQQLYCYRLNYETNTYTFMDELPNRQTLLEV